MLCFGPFVMPGTQMHGWVAFAGSDKVAAVALGRPYTADAGYPSSLPWTAHLLAVTVPPPGWVMP